MSDNLLDIFREEAEEYIKGLNEGLLKLELSSGKDQFEILKEMNRMAHSMKGAARAVGLGLVETISLYMEEIFHAALHQDMRFTPAMGDAFYDGIDLIERSIDDDEPEEDVVSEVLSTLETILAASRLDKDNDHDDADEDDDEEPVNGSFRAHDSAEMKVISDDSKEMPVISDDSTEMPVVTEKRKRTPKPPHAEAEKTSELVQIFWVEVSEYLTELNDGLLQVEMAKAGDRTHILHEMNRYAHSMKGAARAVGFGMVESVSHFMEEIFQLLLDDKLALTPTVADTLYDGLDLIQATLDGDPKPQDVTANVLLELEQLISATPKPQEATPIRGSDPVPPPEVTPTVEIPSALLTTTMETGGVGSPTMMMRLPDETIRVSVNKLDQLMADAGELLIAKLQGEIRHLRLVELRHDHARWQREWRATRAAYIRLARRMQEQSDSVSAEMSALFKFLEMNEAHLVKANRELAQIGQMLAQDNMHLSAMADQLQDNVSQLRMMPFDTILAGFQRMVRDTARDLKKQIHFDVIGSGVDIDKTVLDALKEPLMHLLRNAIDHGLETPSDRLAHGKPAGGKVSLEVEQRGSELVIRVSDDGRGINVNKIREKAVERGILTAQEAQAIGDDEARMLIFYSGFTTNDRVTTFSGRGLGMDIVRTRVENLRGRVSVQSNLGIGTTVTLNVPVSLTRLRVITLRVGEEDYAIPSVMVARMETLSRDAIFTAEGQEMITLNEHPMPLVSMGATLNIPVGSERGDTVNVVALQTADRSVAFEVDHLYSEMELVLKPLGKELANAPFVAGAALLGSGEVIIVLDGNDLVRRAIGSALQSFRARPMVHAPQSQTRQQIRVLVVDDSITTRTLEKNILEAVGFEVFVAMDGSEAWQRIPEIEPDVVVSDVEMPKMTGLELARRIKSTEQTRHLPVILLTSLAKPEQREEGLRAGADAYLVKSRFDQKELLETIQSVL